MTTLTQAQIEVLDVVKEHLQRSPAPDAQRVLDKINALTAAAQVGEPTIVVSDEQTQAAVITAAAKAIYEATIERCAQVVDELAVAAKSAGYETEWNILVAAAAAIRKLKEPQLEPQSSMYQKRPDFVFPEEEP